MLCLIIFFAFAYRALHLKTRRDATHCDAYGVKLCSFSYARAFLLFCIFPPAGGIFIKAFLMSNLHICFCFFFFRTAGRAKPSPFCQATDTLSIQGIVLGPSSLSYVPLPPPTHSVLLSLQFFLPYTLSVCRLLLSRLHSDFVQVCWVFVSPALPLSLSLCLFGRFFGHFCCPLVGQTVEWQH